MSELVIRNRQRTRALHAPTLRRVTRHLLEKEFRIQNYELGFHFVTPKEMASLNEQFLQHAGSTDAITFDNGGEEPVGRLHGEVFICVADAVRQAREFKTTWQSEVVRYIIHSLLHLRGYDDLAPVRKRVMKREEERLVRQINGSFKVSDIARTESRLPPVTSQPP